MGRWFVFRVLREKVKMTGIYFNIKSKKREINGQNRFYFSRNCFVKLGIWNNYSPKFLRPYFGISIQFH